MPNLHELFNHPTPAYQGKPFWSWNGKLEEAELLRQLHVLRRMGMGGAFLHSRVGLATEYLGEEWMRLTGKCMEECKRLGMEAWLYDEDRWPSGSAGGKVTKDPRNRSRILTLELMTAQRFKQLKGKTKLAGTLLGIWTGTVENRRAEGLSFVGTKPGSLAGKLGEHVALVKETEPPLSDWYNGYTYLDTLSKEAVGAYIKSTHELYRKHFGKEFGKGLKGIFTDEPNFGWCWPHRPQTDEGVALGVNNWSHGFAQAFRKRHGYDLLPFIPALFLETEDAQAIRARYHHRDCLTWLFVKNFAQQIGEWCGKHKLPLTGHILLEGDLRNQAMVVGACMPFYEHMQFPGIDILTEFAYEYDTAKQTASVMHQMGRNWMLSELYGCTGWDFPLEGHKAVGDWQMALGVNVRCHHLSWYTMKGEAKRDYPASIFFQSPWWEHYHHIEDYYSRCHVALTQGEPSRRVAVLHPIESMWLKFVNPLAGPAELGGIEGAGSHHSPMSEPEQRLTDMLPELRNMLLEAHYDFDYVDETMLPRLGRVRSGRKGARLRVGKAEYDVLVVPPQETIRATTLRMLRRFVAAGGTVIFVGQPPTLVDALPDDAALELADVAKCVDFKREAVVEALAPWREVSIADSAGNELPKVLYMLRRDGDQTFLFICNTDREAGVDEVRIRLQARGPAAELQPETGGAWKVDADKAGAWLEFKTSLPPTGSRLFGFGPLEKKAPARPQFETKETLELGAPTATQLTEVNSLPLDYASFKLGDDAQWGAPEEILRIDRALRTRLNLPTRSGNMKQPWARDWKALKAPVPLQVRYEFELESLPAGLLEVAHEFRPEARLTLNGQPVAAEAAHGWWVDPCLRRVALPAGALRVGRNTLVVSLEFIESDDLEAMFLLGQFGTHAAGARALVTAPVALAHGNWVEQGLAFYGGAVVYRYALPSRPAAGERFVLKLGDWTGAMVRVLVNGVEAGVIAWQPHELDLSCALAGVPEGEPLELAIELYGSRRNVFGPLHHPDPQSKWIGPDQFVTTGEKWTDEYVLKPVGLFTSPAIEVQRKVH